MKLATFTVDAEARVGVVDPTAGELRDITGLLPAGTGLLEVIENWGELEPSLRSSTPSCPRLPLDQVRLTAPIPVPRRNIICVGRNYRDHAAELERSGIDKIDKGTERTDGAPDGSQPDKPVVFTKAPSAVVGPFESVELHPQVTNEVDYEGELAVVIGTGGRAIAARDAFGHVWGYTILNDITARDLQRGHRQWFLGKSLDTHCPMGPWITTVEEVAVDKLELECRVSGELRQKASVRDLIFSIPALLESISAGLTLQPGDIIATGTPAGVGIGFTPPRFVKRGDVVEVSITGLGTLRNVFR